MKIKSQSKKSRQKFVSFVIYFLYHTIAVVLTLALEVGWSAAEPRASKPSRLRQARVEADQLKTLASLHRAGI